MVPPVKLTVIVILLNTTVNAIRKASANRESLIESLAEAKGISGGLTYDRQKRSGTTLARLLFGATLTKRSMLGGLTYHKFGDYSAALREFRSLKPEHIVPYPGGNGFFGFAEDKLISVMNLKGRRAKIEIHRGSNPFSRSEIVIDYNKSKI